MVSQRAVGTRFDKGKVGDFLEQALRFLWSMVVLDHCALQMKPPIRNEAHDILLFLHRRRCVRTFPTPAIVVVEILTMPNILTAIFTSFNETINGWAHEWGDCSISGNIER